MKQVVSAQRTDSFTVTVRSRRIAMRIRYVIFIMLAAFLAGTACGCAENGTFQGNGSFEPPESEYNWKEVNADHSKLTYVQKQISVPDSIAPSRLIACGSGFLYVTNNLKNQEAVYGITDGDLNIIGEYTLGAASEQSAISCFDAFGETVCFVRCNYEPEQNDVLLQNYILSQYDLGGNMEWELELNENVGFEETAEQMLVTGVAVLPDVGILLTTQNYVYWLNRDGSVSAGVPTEGTIYTPVHSLDGSVFLTSNESGTEIYRIDNETHTIGAALFAYEYRASVLTGCGEYDFLLNTNDKLIGVSLDINTITNLLDWSQCDLTVIPTSVFYVDTDCWWIVGYQIISDESQMIELRGVPANEAAEKQIVRMAVPADENLTAEDVLGYEEITAISEFNATNEVYSLEYSVYRSSEDLQILFLSGDVPDLILFSSTVYQSDIPSEQLFAKKGYFLDLETFLSADPELSTDAFVPGVIETQKNTLGGLYTMPTGVNYKMLYGRTEYVGASTKWSMTEFEAVLSAMDADMRVFSNASSIDALEALMEVAVGSYVDFQSMSCDFESADFAALLRLCKEYFPSEEPQNEVSVEDGTALLDYISTLGGVGQMAQRISEISPYASLKGFPGVVGSGGTLTTGKTYAICSGCPAPEGAWAYLKTLLSDSYQENCIAPYIPVMRASYDKLVDEWIEQNPEAAARELAQQVTEMISNTATRCLYDSPVLDIVLEEGAAYFNDDQLLETTCSVIQSRVRIFLSEQS